MADGNRRLCVIINEKQPSTCKFLLCSLKNEALPLLTAITRSRAWPLSDGECWWSLWASSGAATKLDTAHPRSEANDAQLFLYQALLRCHGSAAPSPSSAACMYAIWNFIFSTQMRAQLLPYLIENTSITSHSPHVDLFQRDSALHVYADSWVVFCIIHFSVYYMESYIKA